MRPPFIQLGGEENFQAYQAEFDKLFPDGASMDVLGNSVVFTRDRCRHICFKPEDTKWNKGPREVWRQDRAERIAWIHAATTRPACICESTGIWVYLLEVERDPENGLHGELFVVKADRDRESKVLYFLTAHTIPYPKWLEYRSVRPWLYPEAEQQSTKTAKKKAKQKKPK